MPTERRKDLIRWRWVRLTVLLWPGLCEPNGNGADHLASTVTRAGKHSVEFAADHLFDELARPSAHLDLDRVKPVVEKASSGESVGELVLG
jgi:hypothetical protein